MDSREATVLNKRKMDSRFLDCPSWRRYFVTWGVAKNYKMYWGGYEYLLYTFPFRSVPKDEFFFNFFLVIMPMRF